VQGVQGILPFWFHVNGSTGYASSSLSLLRPQLRFMNNVYQGLQQHAKNPWKNMLRRTSNNA